MKNSTVVLVKEVMSQEFEMIDNIFIRTDPAGYIKADKGKSTEKIDDTVATIMDLDLDI